MLSSLFSVVMLVPAYSLPFRPACDTSRPFELELAQAAQGFGSQKDGPPLDPRSPQNARQMQQIWTAAGCWTSAFLDAHPDATAEQLSEAFHELPGVREAASGPLSGLGLSAVRLADGAHAVHAVSFATEWMGGTFLIVARGSGHRFHQVWSIQDLATRRPDSDDGL